MISRCKEDKKYADTVAGIFEGTYPSYKAVNANFIIKSILQAAKDIGSRNASDMISNPSSLLQNGLQLSQATLHILDEVKKDPSVHGKWVLSTINKALAVAGHVLKSTAAQIRNE